MAVTTWLEEFNGGAVGEEITTANTNLTIVNDDSFPAAEHPPRFASQAGVQVASTAPTGGLLQAWGNFLYQVPAPFFAVDYASCRARFFIDGIRAGSTDIDILFQLRAQDAASGADYIFAFNRYAASGADIRMTTGGPSAPPTQDVIPTVAPGVVYEFGGDYDSATDVWTTYAKADGVTVWTGSGDIASGGGPMPYQSAGLNAHVFAYDDGAATVTLDLMEFTWGDEPPVTLTPAVRKYPRDDGLGHSSAPRIYPPAKAGRIVGGYQ